MICNFLTHLDVVVLMRSNKQFLRPTCIKHVETLITDRELYRKSIVFTPMTFKFIIQFKSLTTLELNNVPESNHQLQFDLSTMFKQLPRLKSFSLLDNRPSAQLPLFDIPDHLQSLTLCLSLRDYHYQSLTTSNVKSLSLTNHSIHRQDIHCLPASLTNLRVFDINGWSDYDLAQLPKGLKHLCVAYTTNHIGSRSMAYLPHNLETIILGSYWAKTQLDSQMFAYLPRNLKSITTNFAMQNFNHLDLTFLPNKLTILSIDGVSLPSGGSFHILPRSLTWFNYGLEDCKDEYLKDMPQMLVHLKLPKAQGLTTSCFEHLPKTLVTLCLNMLSPIKVVSENHFKNLPSNLTRLEFDVDRELSMDAYGWIPRSITDLTWMNIPWHLGVMKMLPPCLRQLRTESLSKDMEYKLIRQFPMLENIC